MQRIMVEFPIRRTLYAQINLRLPTSAQTEHKVLFTTSTIAGWIYIRDTSLQNSVLSASDS